MEGSRATVDECFESALSTLIAKHFQPELADKIFEADGAGIEWLPELISHKLVTRTSDWLKFRPRFFNICLPYHDGKKLSRYSLVM